MKIGLFFGSFNPIHNGHLIIASHMVEYGGLEKVWFMVSPQNPFKPKDTLLGEELRLQMVQMAIADDPRFEASNFEFTLSKPSYTVHTLEALHQAYPEHEFILIMGADNLHSLHLWKDYEKILEHTQVFVYRRDGFESAELSDHGQVHVFDVPLLNISSTMLRKSLRNHKSVKYLLPDRVEEFIRVHGYYAS